MKKSVRVMVTLTSDSLAKQYLYQVFLLGLDAICQLAINWVSWCSSDEAIRRILSRLQSRPKLSCLLLITDHMKSGTAF